MNVPAHASGKKKILRAGLEVGLLVLLVLAIRAWQQQDLAAGEAPRLQGNLLQGPVFSLRDDPSRPTLVYFWASWCGICRYQTPVVAELARDHRVIGIAMQSGRDAEVVQYLKREQIDLATLNDPESAISRQWGIRGVPALFIVDGKGIIRFRETGYTTGPGLRLRLWLATH